ncbi:M16 family metallopeptidase [Algoriphagus sediminis]|uniref:Pitrilysin family protein n=1 Tax=Algoriphagus sediminis TaxID=3057113 RepID=A0ABT7Y8L9_9BACT|nr:pitrilysin family protein [Algoriphagus sediminis]MDN3202849.1 pitrilysin family protein [Algoriphagus sediminis]
MILDRSKAPKFQVPHDFDLGKPVVYELSNGAKVYFFQTPGIDAVKLETVGISGRRGLPLQEQLVPRLCLDSLLDGTKTFDIDQISEKLDFYATEITAISSFTHEGLRLLSTRKQFWSILPLYLTLFEEATFPQKYFDNRKKQKALAIKIELEKTSSRANTRFREALFGANDPFGYENKAENVESINVEKLKDYYETKLWTDIEIFLAGNFSEAEIEKLFTLLGKIPNREKKSEEPLTQKVHPYFLDQVNENAVQVSLRMGAPSIPMKHPDYLALSVFNTFLGGYFGSRLIKNIREDKGHTYGIYSSLQVIGNLDYVLIGAEIQKGFKEEVIKEIEAEILKLCEIPIPEEELNSVRNYSIGKMLSQFSNSFDLLDRFKIVHRQGLGMNFYEMKLHYLKNFEADEILRIGKKYFSEKMPIRITIG